MAKSVPNTISDKQMADLMRRRWKASPPAASIFVIRKARAFEAQRGKANQS